MNAVTRRAILSAMKIVFVAFVAITLYANLGPQPEPVEIVRVDTVSAAGYRRLWEDAEKSNKGLRAKLEGVKKLTPQTRTVYDTIIKEIKIPVAERVVITGGSAETVTLRPDSAGFRPIRERFAIKNCDDRLEYVRGDIICDPARLGHLTIFARVGAASSLSNGMPDLAALGHGGLHWQPYYRSVLAVELYGDGNGRAHLALRTGLRLF
jgi:hypothetical protein